MARNNKSNRDTDNRDIEENISTGLPDMAFILIMEPGRRGREYKEWRFLVLKRDENQCVICGHGQKYLNAHHIVPKNFLKYALEVDNGITLCPHCHTLGKWSAHKNPIWFTEWLRINRPKTLILAKERLEKEEEEEND